MKLFMIGVHLRVVRLLRRPLVDPEGGVARPLQIGPGHLEVMRLIAAEQGGVTSRRDLGIGVRGRAAFDLREGVCANYWQRPSPNDRLRMRGRRMR
jgi:hypothetical protein